MKYCLKNTELTSGASLYGQVCSLNNTYPDIVIMLMRYYVSSTLRYKKSEIIQLEDKKDEDFKDIASKTFIYLYPFIKKYVG